MSRYRCDVVYDNDNVKWQEIYKIAQQDHGHRLWQNYQNIDLSDYEHMILLLENDVPIGFAGIYNDGRWPLNISRMFSRTYLKSNKRKYPHGPIMAAYSIKFILDNFDRWGKDAMFTSRGVQYNDPIISWESANKLGKFFSKRTGYDLITDPVLYQCCPKETRSCYQYCIWYDPQQIRKKLDIPNITKMQWLTLPE